MKALITAAGMGRRMAVEKHTNKCLLEVGGKSILKHSIDSLVKNGVTEIFVVTGHLSEKVEKELGNTVLYFHNNDYANSGINVSISKAKSALYGEEFLLIMGDLYFHPDMIDRCINDSGNISVSLERKDSYNPEDSKVWEQKGKIVCMGKDLPSEMTNGEFGHMLKLDAAGSKLLFDEIDSMLKIGLEKAYLMETLNRLISKGHIVNAVDITGIPRIEIDFAEDLDDARKHYLPLINPEEIKLHTN